MSAEGKGSGEERRRDEGRRREEKGRGRRGMGVCRLLSFPG